MDKKLKIILLVFSLFLFSGCTIDYNIKIKANNKIEENILLNATNTTQLKNSELNKYYNKIYNYLLKDYDYKFSLKDNKVDLKLNKKTNNLNDFITKSNIILIYDNYELTTNEGKTTFRNVGLSNFQSLFDYADQNNNPNTELVDKININITFENIVVENNADSYNKKTNTYTWIYTRDTKIKNIKFVFGEEKFKKQYKINKNITIYGSIIVVILITGISTVLIISHKKNKF